MPNSNNESKDITTEHKNSSMLFIVLVIIAIIIAILGGWFFLFDGQKKIEKIFYKKKLAENVHKSVFVPMDDFIVDLVSTGRKNNFLKLKVTLETEKQEDVENINFLMPRIRDIFQSYLHNLREDDLQGNAGIDRLREELLLRVNKITYPIVIVNVLFSEFIIN